MLFRGLGGGRAHIVKEMDKSLLSSPLFPEASRLLNRRDAWNPVRQPQMKASEFELWSQVDLGSGLCSVFPSCESEASLLICLFIFTSEDNGIDIQDCFEREV